MVGIVVVGVLSFSLVRPTNFGGWDEWVDIDLASRGVLSVPYQNRPLSLLFFLPGAALWSGGLETFKWVQLIYLTATGVLTLLICRRLAGVDPALAFLAGVVAATWAPADRIRLDVVLGRGYAGATAGALFAILLLIESYRAGRILGLVLASAVATAVVASVEAAAPLILGAPALLWLGEGGRGRRLLWAVVFGIAPLLAVTLVAIPLVTQGESSYQASAIGLDPHPFRVASRLLVLAGYHLAPLFSFDPSQVLRPIVLGAVAAFTVAWIAVGRAATPATVSWRSLGRLALVGLAAAAFGWAAFALSSGIKTPDRTQLLSAPGVGLLLAVAARSLARVLPRPSPAIVLGVCGAWIVGLGAARTAALQREWDETSLWPAQNRALVALTDLVPRTARNTLIVFIDEQGAWPANFTFRHAIEYLYGGEAKGWVPGAHGAYLYPAVFTERGLRYEPWPAIREAWRAPVTDHGFDEMIAVRFDSEGRLRIEDDWPGAILPPLPPGARYAPRPRILPGGSPIPARRILCRPPCAG